MAIATALNSSLWVGYGALVARDPFVWAPNVFGSCTSFFQLGLFALYGVQRIGDNKESAELPAGRGKGQGMGKT